MVERLDREAAARQVAIALACLSAFLLALARLGVLRQSEATRAFTVELRRSLTAVMVKYRLPSIPGAELQVQWLEHRVTLPEILTMAAELARELQEAQSQLDGCD